MFSIKNKKNYAVFLCRFVHISIIYIPRTIIARICIKRVKFSAHARRIRRQASVYLNLCCIRAEYIFIYFLLFIFFSVCIFDVIFLRPAVSWHHDAVVVSPGSLRLVLPVTSATGAQIQTRVHLTRHVRLHCAGHTFHALSVRRKKRLGLIFLNKKNPISVKQLSEIKITRREFRIKRPPTSVLFVRSRPPVYNRKTDSNFLLNSWWHLS